MGGDSGEPVSAAGGAWPGPEAACGGHCVQPVPACGQCTLSHDHGVRPTF